MYTRSKLNKTVTWILLAIALIFILPFDAGAGKTFCFSPSF